MFIKRQWLRFIDVPCTLAAKLRRKYERSITRCSLTLSFFEIKVVRDDNENVFRIAKRIRKQKPGCN